MAGPIEVTTGGPIGGVEVDRVPILDVFKDVCLAIGLSVPSAVFASTDREHQELASLANEMAYRIAVLSNDWTTQKRVATLTGDGSDSFALPPDYARMLKKARLWSSQAPNVPLRHVTDSDEWLMLDVSAFQSEPYGRWTLIGDELLISPALADGAKINFFYVTKLIAYDKDGAPKPRFTKDDDAFVLNERLLKLGMIWQWKANKGFAYQEDMANYEEALSTFRGSDRGSITIRLGGPRPLSGNVTASYPWPLG